MADRAAVELDAVEDGRHYDWREQGPANERCDEPTLFEQRRPNGHDNCGRQGVGDEAGAYANGLHLVSSILLGGEEGSNTNAREVA